MRANAQRTGPRGARRIDGDRRNAAIRMYELDREIRRIEATMRAASTSTRIQGRYRIAALRHEAAQLFDRHPQWFITRIQMRSAAPDLGVLQPESFAEAEHMLDALPRDSGPLEIAVQFVDGTRVGWVEPLDWWRYGIKRALALATWLEATSPLPEHAIGPWARLWAETFSAGTPHEA